LWNILSPLYIHYRVITLHNIFHFSIFNQCEENERKLQIIGIFLSSRAITLSKIARIYPNRSWPRYSYDKCV
jgi:hypothetical protein